MLNRACIASLAFAAASACGGDPSIDPPRPHTVKDSPAPQGDDEQLGEPAVDEAGLPPYLVSAAEAESFLLNPVLPYAAPDFAEAAIEDQAQSHSRFVAAVRRFLADLTRQPVFRTPRDLRVSVVDDSVVNAAANAHQRITYTRAFIEQVNSIELAATTCHELAHAVRNHVVGLEAVRERVFGTAEQPSAAVKAFNAKVQAYINRQYTSSSSTYVHDRSAYLGLKQEFDAFTTELTSYRKRIEAEADAVGAILCGQIGFAPKQFKVGIASVLAKLNASTSNVLPRDPTQIPDGERLTVKENEINQFLDTVLFSTNLYPTDTERAEQAGRLEPILVKAFRQGGSAFETLAQSLGSPPTLTDLALESW